MKLYYFKCKIPANIGSVFVNCYAKQLTILLYSFVFNLHLKFYYFNCIIIILYYIIIYYYIIKLNIAMLIVCF